jgi:hypothetical protein
MEAGTKHRFQGELIARGPKGAWTYMPVPLDVPALFGTKGMVPLIGTMNGFPFRTSLMPAGDAQHILSISKELKSGAAAQAGDLVDVVLERDTAERRVEVPAPLSEAFAEDAAAGERFAGLSYSHQKAFAAWIESAKRDETRSRRVQQALTMLREGKTID